jgi:hypothetical protein
MTFAELVIKFSTTGDTQTKSQIKAIEVELKNVSNASINAANRVSQSFQKIGQASNSFQALQGFGSNLSNQFIQAATGGNQFSSTLVDLAQSLLLLESKLPRINFKTIFSKLPVNELIFNVNTLNNFLFEMAENLALDALTLRDLTKSFGILAGLDISKFFDNVAQSAVSFMMSSRNLQAGLASVWTFLTQRLGPALVYVYRVLRPTITTILEVGKVFLSFGGYVLGAVAALAAFSAAVVAMDLSIVKETVKASFAFEKTFEHSLQFKPYKGNVAFTITTKTLRDQMKKNENEEEDNKIKLDFTIKKLYVDLFNIIFTDKDMIELFNNSLKINELPSSGITFSYPEETILEILEDKLSEEIGILLKEDNDKKRIRKAIKRVASKNHRLIPVFKEKHPDCSKSNSPYSDQYNKIIVEAMGGSGDNDLEKENKIIKNITKVTTIDK